VFSLVLWAIKLCVKKLFSFLIIHLKVIFMAISHFPKRLLFSIVFSLITLSVLAQPAFRDASTQSFNAAAGAFSLSINKPVAAVAGDIMFLSIGVRNENTVSVPTDWISISVQQQSTEVAYALFYKYCGVSEPSAYTVSWAVAGANTISRDAVASIVAYDVEGKPFIRYASTEGSSATPTAPDTTSLYANNRVIRFAITGDNLVSGHTIPASTVSRVAIESGTASNEITLLIADGDQAAAGATGTAAFGVSASANYGAFTVAFYDPSALAFPAFGCTNELFQTAAPNSSTPIEVFDLSTDGLSYISIGGDIGYNYNAMGYSVLDNYMYGLGRGNGNIPSEGKIPGTLNRVLIQVAANGEVKQLADVGVGSFSADMDFNGNLWAMSGSGFTKISTSAPYTKTAYPIIVGAEPWEVVNDVVYIQKDGVDYFYGVEGEGVAPNIIYYLYRFEIDEITPGVKISRKVISDPSGDMQAGGLLAGAMFTDFNSNLFAGLNDDGSIWLISDYEGTPDALRLANPGIATLNNDGASCPNAFSRFFTPIEAVDDVGADPIEGVAGSVIANVVINDEFNSLPTDLTEVTLSFVSASDAGITLNTTTGEVSASATVAPGIHTLVYKICEPLQALNCSEATVTFNIGIVWDGTQWINGADVGTPSGDESLNNFSTITVYPGLTGTSADEAPLANNVVIENLIIKADAVLNMTGCMTVDVASVNQGLVRMVATSDEVYGQYLGPALNDVECQMFFDNGWHNIGFPVDITASVWAAENNTGQDLERVNLTNNEVTQNLRWYDSFTSGGKELGFFIAASLGAATSYSTHAYGRWNMVSDGTATFGGDADQDLSTKAFSFYLDEFFFNTSRMLSATGTTNAGEKTYQTSNNFGGFNLIPNIYPVSVDLDLIWNDASNGFGNILNPLDNNNPYFSNVIYLWDPTNSYTIPLLGDFGSGSYVVYDPETGNAVGGNPAEIATKADQYLAPFQAFYVHRADASIDRRRDQDGTDLYSTPGAAGNFVAAGATTDPGYTNVFVEVTMSPDFRSSCVSTKHFKTTNGPAVTDVILLVAQEANNIEVGDATEIAFADHYTQGYDRGYDILKNSNGGIGAPTLFSIQGKDALVINKQSYPTKDHSILLGFKAPKDKNGTNYTFTAPLLPSLWSVYLEDKMTRTWHKLDQEDYTFKYNSNSKLERFALHFNRSGAPIESSFDPSTKAWRTDEGIEVSFNSMKSLFAEITVSNVAGQTLFVDRKVSTEDNYVIPMANGAQELFVVTVRSLNLSESHKVLR
jgi:hypothetical protein